MSSWLPTALRACAGNRNKGTDNRNKGTDNRNKGTGNRNKGTDDRSFGTGNRNKGTDNRTKGTGNRSKGTDNANTVGFRVWINGFRASSPMVPSAHATTSSAPKASACNTPADADRAACSQCVTAKCVRAWECA